MSYRLPRSPRSRRPLGQVQTFGVRIPRTGIGGSGITWEMVGLDVGFVGLFGAWIAWERTKSRLWQEAIPDADERFMTRLVTGF